MTIKKQLFLMGLMAIIFSTAGRAHVALDHPAGGEIFDAGEVVNIQWHISIDHGPCSWDLCFSSDGGATWDTLVTDLPKPQQNYDWSVPNTATTEGRIKVFMDNVAGPDYQDASADFTVTTPTGIADIHHQMERFVLRPAYPNPFNSTTVISFDLPARSYVKIRVFDILGHEIQTLSDRELLSGRHQITWNAADLPSGIYFYNITTGNVSATRRLILIK